MLKRLNRLSALAAALFTGFGLFAQMPEGANRTALPTAGGDKNAIIERATRRRMLANAREAAAVRTQAALKAKGGKVDLKSLGVNPAAKALTTQATKINAKLGVEAQLAVPGPGFQLNQPDYMFGTATNWHNTKPIHKFMDTLPGLGAENANLLGNYIPLAVNLTPGGDSDYYELDVVEYKQQLHSELAPTKLRGYQNHNANFTNGSTASNYLGPIIIAKKDRAVRVKLFNQLPTGTAGDLFIPVDTTMMGAGVGPKGGLFTQNRALLHLHGGLSPWISDGTPHQWVTPAGENTLYPKGATFQNVPDMAANATPTDGIATYYWTNQQSGRFMFYHDHSFGLTRLNVYAGEAAGYLIVDPVEEKLINAGILPNNLGLAKGANHYNYGIPLVIQDKTFVDTATLGTVGQLSIDPVTGLPTPATDPTWDVNKYGGDGSLWYPHVYMPNQNPADISGANAMGRWDYGAWFWPPLPLAVNNNGVGLQHGAEPVVGDPNGTEIPGTPNPSLVPEAFMDTPVVNGVAYPTVTVDPKAYRFRILNAANDRFWNLSFFTADPAAPTEVVMVPSAPTAGWPTTWPTDGRAGGVPDPATAGPSFIQIGNESGFLPTPVVIAPQPVSYNYNRRDIVVLNVQDKGLFLGAAERADVIVDFSAYAGKTLILYNDAPAPVPAFDARLDYYTGDPDQRDSGGADTTLPGFGPNTRTIMQVNVAAGTPEPFNLDALNAAFTGTPTTNSAFVDAQHLPIVPQAAYSSAMNTAPATRASLDAAGMITTPTTFANNVYVRIQDTQIRYPFPAMENGVATQPALAPKAIQELFELDYGRMNATLGVELPLTNFTNQTTIPLGYADPATELLTDGTTQYWKITHNGVDTHPVHFHLFDVQVVNRVGWDGAVRLPDPNELGWKETVKMNPLEDIIVAFRPLSPRLPFVLPNSKRVGDVTKAEHEPITWTSSTNGNPIAGTNEIQDFGWEYVWHCHILGHEENDFMRPMVLNVATSVPDAPSALKALTAGNAVSLSWMDGSTNETGFSIQRRPGGVAGNFVEIATVVPNVNAFTDFTTTLNLPYDYQVVAYNQAGSSAPSNATAVNAPTSVVQVSGIVRNLLTGAGQPNVTVTFPGASPVVTATTQADGTYTATVPYLYSGSIVPSLLGFVFSPASRSASAINVDQTGQDFTAIPLITISGQVAFGTGGLSGATVTTSTGLSATTDASGNYAFIVPAPFTGTLSAAKAGYFITPLSISITSAISDQPNQNFTAVVGYNVTGRIQTNATVPQPLPGVTLTFVSTNTPPAPTFTAVTNATGNYTHLVPTGWTGSITPALTAWAFQPALRNLSNVTANTGNQNFTARPTITISGYATTASLPLSGAQITFSGNGGASATTNASGYYSLIINSGWTGNITATKSGYTLSPTGLSVTTPVTLNTTYSFITVQTISGRTRNQLTNANVGGVTLTATTTGGTVLTSVLSNNNGNFTLTVPTGWSGTVSASGIFPTWSPVSYGYSNLATNLTGQNFTGK